jgi:hypothetical protein
MSLFQVFTVADRFVAMAICTALTLMVLMQLDRDRAGYFFALMAFCVVMIAFFSLLSQFAGLMNAGDAVARRLYSIGSVFAALFPCFIFMFTIEFLGVWVRWRRRIAGLLLGFGLLTSVYMLTDTAFETFHLGTDGYFSYQV